MRIQLENRSAALKEIAENETLSFEVRNNAARDYLAIQKELINNEARLAEFNSSKTAGELQLIALKQATAIQKTNSEAAQLVYKIWKDNQKDVADLFSIPDVPEATKEQANELLAIVDEGLKKELALIEEAEKKKADARKQGTEAAIRSSYDILQSVADAFYDKQATKRQQELDSIIDSLNLRKDAELSVKNITEQQKDEINRRYAQRERQLRLKAFDEEKKAKRNQAIINGLLGITNAIATAANIYAGLALAAVVATNTAIQVNKINNTSPGFKKGGYTGNKGRDEVAGVVHGQEFVAHADATAAYKPALEAMNKMKFDEYMASVAPMYSPPVMTALPDWANDRSSTDFDYEQMGRAVAKYSKDPQMIMNADQDGLSMFLIEAGNRKQILNKRYKL